MKRLLKMNLSFLAGLVFGSVISTLTSYALLWDIEISAAVLELKECLEEKLEIENEDNGS